ncbi:hypothetical protein HMPREF0731_0544 [Pseudoroseomonas cervicalis ATCC 49957]|uniref:Uncharacterized protein n=1 Tax=Pseudoroseomonas cervicalis ATCC 49957 TaxID=525371 RepID=D5RHI5_9PROT|nr:hypothetical protein HMPREF0731_0544 [Pseudoroseomonas cervicalis ATCC 49957]
MGGGHRRTLGAKGEQGQDRPGLFQKMMAPQAKEGCHAWRAR